MNDLMGLVGVAVLVLACVFGARTCKTEMDAEHCITVCNARVDSYNDITTQCECKR